MNRKSIRERFNSTFLAAITAVGMLLAGAASLNGQSTGLLSGSVRDSESNLILPGASVTIDEVGRSTSADRNGRYSISGIPPGTYKVSVSYLGYNPTTQTVTITAGEPTLTSFTLGSDIVELEAYEVQGIRTGQARALSQQKESITVMNIVSADAVSKLPDDNAAEAVARIVGVHTNRNEGDGRYIYIRGVMPSLNLHTIDGVRVPTAEANARRRVAMDVLPSDMIGQIEVHKGLSPEMDGDTIGGIVEIKTRSPFDRDQRYFGGGVEWGQQDFSNLNTYKVFGTYSDVLGEEKKVGVTISATWLESDRLTPQNEVEEWTFNPFNGEIIPNENRLFHKELTRSRLGVSGALEFRVNDENRFFLSANFAQVEDYEVRQRMRWQNYGGNVTLETSDRFSGEGTGRIRRQIRENKMIQELLTVRIGGEHRIGNIEVDHQFSYGYTEEDTPLRNERRWQSANFLTAWDFTDQFYPDASSADGYDNFDSDNYRLTFWRDRAEFSSEKEWSWRGNMKYDLDFGDHPGFIKGGAKLALRDHEKRDSRYVWGDFGREVLMTEFVESPTLEIDLGSGGVFQYGPKLSLAKVEAFQDAESANWSDFEFENSDSFDALEDTLAVYAMAGVDLGRMKIQGGVRWEGNSSTYSLPFYQPNPDNPSPLGGSADTTSSQFLPSIQFRYAASDNLIILASAGRSYGRPVIGLVTPNISVDDVEETIGGGNPFLENYDSWNFDLTAQYFFSNIGVVSAGVFYKKVDGYVYARTGPVGSDVFDSIDPSTGEVIDRSGYLFTSFLNSDSGNITGLELAFQRQFSELPAPFDGLGVDANYTLVSSSVDITYDDGSGGTGKREVPFFGQADDVANLSFYYSKGKWEARISWNFRSPFLQDEVGNFAPGVPSFDTYHGEEDYLDFKIAYQINRHFSVNAQMSNINDQPGFEQFETTNPRLRQLTRSGTFWRIGFGWQL